MGVFDYLSSLLDSKGKPQEKGPPGKKHGRDNARPAPSKHRADSTPSRSSSHPNGQKARGARSHEPAPSPERRGTEGGAKTTGPHAPSRVPDHAVPTVSTNTTPAHPERPAPAAVVSSQPQPARAKPGDEIDRALDEALGEGASEAVEHTDAAAKELDASAVRELFAGIAAGHARPVKNFLFELRRGTATREYIEICQPVMESLFQAAESMDLPEVARRMGEFREALALAAESGEEAVEGAARELLLSTYDEMARSLPEAFHEGDDERRRETIIIHALLKQVPDVGHVSFERLYGAGLTSLEALFLANPPDLSITTGIPLRLCERICACIEEHRKDLARSRRQSGAGERRALLRNLVVELRDRHEGFEKASAEHWASSAAADRKREMRQGRQLCALKVEVALAELGELDLVETIQKLPFCRRIETLEEFIANAATLPVEAVAAHPATTERP